MDPKARALLPLLTPDQRAFLKRADDPVSHWCDWSGQPHIHFACGTWTTPAWGQPGEIGAPNASAGYLADNGDAYLFDRPDLVTCEDCKAWLAAHPRIDL